MNPLLPQLPDQVHVPIEFPENFQDLLNAIIPIDQVINEARVNAGLPPLTVEQVDTVNTRIQWIVNANGEIMINILSSLIPLPTTSLRSAYMGSPQRHAQIEQFYFNLRPEHIEQYLSSHYGMYEATLDLYRYHRDLTATYAIDQETTNRLVQMAKDMDKFVRLHMVRSATKPIIAQRQQDKTTAAVLQYARTVHPDIFKEIVTTQLGAGNYLGLVQDIDTTKRISQLQHNIAQQQAKQASQRNQELLQKLKMQLQDLR